MNSSPPLSPYNMQQLAVHGSALVDGQLQAIHEQLLSPPTL